MIRKWWAEYSKKLIIIILILGCAEKPQKIFVSNIAGNVQDIQLISVNMAQKRVTYVLPVIKDVLTPWMVCLDSEIVGIYDRLNFCGWVKSKENEFLPLYGVTSDNKSFSVLGRNEGEKYDVIGSDRELVITISADSTKYAYWARKDSLEFMVVDDKPENLYRSVGRPIISKKNNIIAYKAYKKNKWYIVFNGKELGPYEAVGQPVLSHSGSSVAFVSASGGKWEDKDYLGGKWFVVVDGKIKRSYDWTGTPVYSNDDKHIAYRASVGGKWVNKTYAGGRWFTVFDDTEIGNFTGTSDPVFTKKNNLISFIGTKENGWFISLDKKEIGPFDYVDRFNIALKEGSDDIAYIASLGGKWSSNKYYGGKWFIVLNGKKGQEFDCIWIPPQFDTTSNLLAYVGSNGGVWDSTGYYEGNYFMVTSDGEKEVISSPLPLIHSFRFSPYKKGAYVVIIQPRKNKFQILFFDGTKATFSSLYDGIQDVIFHPSGKSVLYIISEKKQWQLINLTEKGEKTLLKYAFIATTTIEDDGKVASSFVLDKKKNQAFIVKSRL